MQLLTTAFANVPVRLSEIKNFYGTIVIKATKPKILLNLNKLEEHFLRHITC